MKKNAEYVRSMWTGWITVLIFAFAGLLAGCATSGNYGTLQRSQELNQKIMNFEVLPGYNYYTSGGYDKPNAILGIHEDYELVSKFWEPVPISTAQMQKWIDAIAPESYRGPVGYFAAYILDPDGKKVGFWYSIQNTTTIKFLGGNKIEVYTPSLIQPGDLQR